jgi:hypothetical protein
VILQKIFHYQKTRIYQLSEDFLADQITANISYAFMILWKGIGEKLNQMKIEESV